MTTLMSNTARDAKPEISCIITAFGEGKLAQVSIDSILSQSFNNFEILIVDDGADEATRETISNYDDPRIVYIRQENDGPSSARNRALSLARGEYICFLDADDTRPTWAFDSMLRTAKESNADVVFTAGLLSELRKDILPFYDSGIIDKIIQLTGGHLDSKSPDFKTYQPLLALLEPQSANKLIRRDFLQRHMIRFPAGILFEDLVFHVGIILCANKIALNSAPCFTYFRRYGPPQITGSRGLMRFDSITSTGATLNLLQNSAYFQSPELRTAVLASCFKVVQWCEDNAGHNLRWQFRQAAIAMLTSLDQRYLIRNKVSNYSILQEAAPWIANALNYFEILSAELETGKYKP